MNTSDSLREAILCLRTEVNCRIEHGAESGGRLEYVQAQLDNILANCNIMPIPISTSDPVVLRALAGNPGVQSEELYKAESNHHKYKPGETRTLTGLVDFPEYNGQQVIVTSIRKDGPRGKAYYIKGEINEVANWIYEYRLK